MEIPCHVFCRDSLKINETDDYEGRKLIYVKGSKSRKLDTFISSIQTGIYLLKHRKEYEYIFWFNNANIFGIILSLFAGIPICVNTDGLEWRRAKWSLPFKLFYFTASFIISRVCKKLISDSISIQEYYKKVFFKKTEFIPYGAPQRLVVDNENKTAILNDFDVEENKYFLQITRFEPDNLPLDIAKSFQESELWKKGYKFILIGMKDQTPYTGEINKLTNTKGFQVFPANYDPMVLTVLRENAYCYLHGNSVGGTNPALLEAMQSCKRIMAIDSPFSKEVLGKQGCLFGLDNLADLFLESVNLPDQGQLMKDRIDSSYQWDSVADSYLNVINNKQAAYMGNNKSIGKRNLSVGIIIVNYNGFEDTMDCISSLGNLRYENKKIYVVDNNSPDKSGKLLKNTINSIKNLEIEFIQLEQNIGFAGGNNIAIKQAINEGFDCVWLLNNDTVVDDVSLDTLVDTMEDNDKVGIVGSKIYFFGSNKIWFAGGNVNIFGISSHRGYCEDDSKGMLYRNTEVTGYITGCSLLIKSEVIQEVGYLDEQFFLYYEDTEFNLRAKKKGWSILFEPKSLVWHKVSASTKSEFHDHAPVLDYYDIRNHIIFINKTYSHIGKLLPYLGVVYKFIKKHIRLIVRSESRKKEKIKCVYRGLNDGLVNKSGAFLYK